MIDDHADVSGTIPVQVPDVVTETVDGELLLFHPGLPNVHYLSATAALIWALCDGRRDVGAIVALLEAAYPDAGPGLSGDVRQVLSDLRGSGVLAYA